MGLKDIEPAKFIEAYAAHLKKGGKVTLPAYVDIVKTAHYKELAPIDKDWYYTRIATVARQVYLQPRGVGALRRAFGGNKNNGSAPEHKALAAGSIIRSALQQLEKLGIVEKNAKGGRVVTNKGKQEIDKIANSLLKVSA